MTETAEMLEVRLALIDRIRLVERTLGHADQAQLVAELIRGHTHALGNHIQIVKLASLELERRAAPEQAELIRDLRAAADHAAETLSSLFAAAQPGLRAAAGPPAIAVVREAAESARGALAATLTLRLEAGDGVRTDAAGDELEAIVLAALLDARGATRIELAARERMIEDRPWLELLRIDDRREIEPPGELAPPALLEIVDRIATRAGGEVSRSEGRTGAELAIALPVRT